MSVLDGIIAQARARYAEAATMLRALGEDPDERLRLALARERGKRMAVEARVEALQGRISQLESERKADSEGGPKPPRDSSSANGHRSRVTIEMARDVVVKEAIGPFSSALLTQRLGVSRVTAQRLLNELGAQGIIRRPPGSPNAGPYARWEHVIPDGNQPRRRPRGEPKIAATQRAAMGVAVPGVHRPEGPAPTPGKLKRQQAKGRRVRHKPVKGVRI